MLRSRLDAALSDLKALVCDDARLAGMARRAAPILGALLLAILVGGSWPDADARHDATGAVFGHDLSQIWVAGQTARAGRAAEVYDFARHGAAITAFFGPDAPFFGWHYPPVFLLPAAGLAALPYPVAVPLWAALSLGAMAVALTLALALAGFGLVLARPRRGRVCAIA